MMQATLTLPGIAAVALTLGMAIDANVLINERVREELRSGMTPQMAIQAGYDRAFGTILDSNVTTLIVGPDAARLRLGPGARVRGRALPGHPHLDLQRRGGLARDRQPRSTAGARRCRSCRSGTRRGMTSTATRKWRCNHGILQDPARDPVHAPCEGLQRDLAGDLPHRRGAARHARAALLHRVHRRHGDGGELREGGRARQDPRRAAGDRPHGHLGAELRHFARRADPAAAQVRGGLEPERRTREAGGRGHYGTQGTGRHGGAEARGIRRRPGRQGARHRRRAWRC